MKLQVYGAGMLTYEGVVHHVARRSLRGQVQGPCDDVHVLAAAGQLPDKALEACPVVPASVPPDSAGMRDLAARTSGVTIRTLGFKI